MRNIYEKYHEKIKRRKEKLSLSVTFPNRSGNINENLEYYISMRKEILMRNINEKY